MRRRMTGRRRWRQLLHAPLFKGALLCLALALAVIGYVMYTHVENTGLVTGQLVVGAAPGNSPVAAAASRLDVPRASDSRSETWLAGVAGGYRDDPVRPLVSPPRPHPSAAMAGAAGSAADREIAALEGRLAMFEDELAAGTGDAQAAEEYHAADVSLSDDQVAALLDRVVARMARLEETDDLAAEAHRLATQPLIVEIGRDVGYTPADLERLTYDALRALKARHNEY